MSAIALTVMILLAGQIVPGTEKDFGWEIDRNDGALQYIVQISPEQAARMQQKSVAFPNGQEATSEIPNELVGRATRVVIRIGTMDLPRSPSLQEIDRMKRFGDPINPSSTAQLDPGIYKQLEPPPAFNIGSDNQGVQPAPLPSFPSEPMREGSLADAARGTFNSLRDDVADSLSSATDFKTPEGRFPDPNLFAQKGNNAIANMRDQFLNGAGGSTEKFNSLPKQSDPNQPGTGAPTLPALPGTMAANGNATNNPSSIPNNSVNSSTTSNWPNARGQSSSAPFTGANPTNFAGQNPPQAPLSTFGAAPSTYDRLAGNSALPGNNRMTQAQDPYAQQNYPTQVQAFNNANSAPPYTPAPPSMTYDPRTDPASLAGERMARNTTTSPTSSFPAVAASQATASPSGVAPSADGSTTTTSDTALKLFFLVSLLVNLYLGILLRKLMTRYRSLLTNVRSQMA